MKKTFKLMAVAAIASMTLVACNNQPAETTDTIDTTIAPVVEEAIQEPVEVLDTTAKEVEEQVATTAKKAVKKAVKKAEATVEKNTEAAPTTEKKVVVPVSTTTKAKPATL